MWGDANTAGFAYKKAVLEDNDNPFRMGGVRMVKTVRKATDASIAQWRADMPKAGEYAVYVSYASFSNSATDALYRVNSLAGTKEFKVNQRMGEEHGFILDISHWLRAFLKNLSWNY